MITGAKNWTSRIDESDLALVLARTSDKGQHKTKGLTLFLVDLRQVRAEQPDALQVTKVRTMFNYATPELATEISRRTRPGEDHLARVRIAATLGLAVSTQALSQGGLPDE